LIQRIVFPTGSRIFSAGCGLAKLRLASCLKFAAYQSSGRLILRNVLVDHPEPALFPSFLSASPIPAGTSSFG